MKAWCAGKKPEDVSWFSVMWEETWLNQHSWQEAQVEAGRERAATPTVPRGNQEKGPAPAGQGSKGGHCGDTSCPEWVTQQKCQKMGDEACAEQWQKSRDLMGEHPNLPPMWEAKEHLPCKAQGWKSVIVCLEEWFVAGYLGTYKGSMWIRLFLVVIDRPAFCHVEFHLPLCYSYTWLNYVPFKSLYLPLSSLIEYSGVFWKLCFVFHAFAVDH